MMAGGYGGIMATPKEDYGKLAYHASICLKGVKNGKKSGKARGT